MRNLTARLIAPVLYLTGYRFSRDFRHGTTRARRIVYAMVNTVTANHLAGL
jgi:hypothetical protein